MPNQQLLPETKPWQDRCQAKRSFFFSWEVKWGGVCDWLMAGPALFYRWISLLSYNRGITENTCIFLREMKANFLVQLARVLHASLPTQRARQQNLWICDFRSRPQHFNLFGAEAFALEVAQVAATHSVIVQRPDCCHCSPWLLREQQHPGGWRQFSLPSKDIAN